MSEPKAKHVTDQLWVPELREDGLYLIGADDKSVVLKMQGPDRDSDLLVAGYVAGLQAQKIRELHASSSTHLSNQRIVVDAPDACVSNAGAWLGRTDLHAVIEIHRLSCHQADCPVLAAMEAVAASRASREDLPS